MPPEMASAAAAPTPAVRALDCPSCGGTIQLRAAGYTVTVACIYCGSLLDVANPDVRLIKEYHEAAAQLEIPLGTRGTLRGVEWEAIGYVRRSEGGDYPWVEYLLFNPYHGYRWLITNGRGWSFGEQLTRAPHWSDGSFALDGESYAPFFTDGRAQVDYVLGEFYWRVKVGETVATDDYVRPGFMLSREANEQEISWSRSELLARREIGEAFGVSAPRNPWPPLPHQPSPYRKVMSVGWKIALGAFVFLLLVTMLFAGGATLLKQTLPVTLDGRENSVTFGPVTVTRPYQLVRIRAEVPTLSNAWVDLDYSLVNRANQETYQAYGVAERYSGRDSDGDWTEGSRGATVKLAAIPAGTYDLVVDYSGNRWGSGSSSTSYAPPLDMPVSDKPLTDEQRMERDLAFTRGEPPQAPETGETMNIEVAQGFVFPSNFILALLLILLPLIFFFSKHLKFEKARQTESDAGPTGLAAMFEQSDDDEEEE
jgi:hypothetical protein